MIIRKMLLMALVAISGAQSVAHAAEAPKAKAEKSESWAAWYKRNKVLVGAATGAAIMGVLAYTMGTRTNQEFWRRLGPDQAFRFRPCDSTHYLACSVLGGMAGAIAAKLNVLGGFCLGIATGGLVYCSAKPSSFNYGEAISTMTSAALAGGVMGATAQKRNTLPGFVAGSVGLAAAGLLASKSPDSALLVFPGAIIGAGINELYNSDQQPEEDKQNKE